MDDTTLQTTHTSDMAKQLNWDARQSYGIGYGDHQSNSAQLFDLENT